MKKLVLVFIVVTIVVAVAILYFNRPEATPKPTAILPDTTLLYVDFPNLQDSFEHWKTTPAYALWQEKEVQDFVRQPLALMRAGFNDSSKDPGLISALLQQLSNLPPGNSFLAVTHVDSASFNLTALVGADLKEHKPDFQSVLEQYEKQFVKDNANAKVEKKTWLGSKYTTWWYSPKLQIHQTFLGTMLLASSDEEALRDAITRAVGQARPDAPSLAASLRYQQVVQKLPAEHDLQAYVNIHQLVSDFGMWLMMAAQMSPAISSVAEMQSYASSVHFNDQGFTDVGLLTYATNHTVSAALTKHTLPAIPPNSTFYHAGTSDLAHSFVTLMNLLAHSGNATALNIGSQLDKFLSNAGVRLDDDFLAHLGPEIAYLGNWRSGAQYPDLALVVEVKDPLAFAKYDRIVSAIKQAVPTSEDRPQLGEVLHVVGSGSSVITPTYVLTDKYFVLALSESYAREILTQIKAGKSFLTDSEDYKTSLRWLPKGGNSITYCDLGKMIGGLYSLAHSSVMTQADGNITMQFSKLPSADAVSRHLGSYVSTTTETADYSLTTSHSPCGKPATGLTALIGSLIVAQPWLSQLPLPAIPGLPTMSSGTAVPPPPAGNRKAASQTP